MRAEYKRDMNHNYLILYGENEINTDSYQVRMLVGNVIPSLLKCRIQGMDGRFLVYFDITSKQSLNVLYEDKKMGVEDLRLIFGGFVKAMEDAAEYLMNPGQFIISPEYIYTDIEKREIYFCMMPGHEKDIKEQFQSLTEYILPKIDHQDGDAVVLGYGVYKRAIEDSFHLEHIKEELYKVQGQSTVKRETEQTEAGSDEKEKPEDVCLEADFRENAQTDQEFVRDGEKSKGLSLPQKICIIAAAVTVSGIIAAVSVKGYLPYVETGTILGAIVALVACVMLIVYVLKVKKKSGILRQRREERQDRPDWEAKDRIIVPDEEKPEKSCMRNSASETISKAPQQHTADYGETIVLSAGVISGPASLVSREPGELATIYLNEDLTVIGKLETACDAVVSLPTVSRIHAKIRKKEEAYYLTDMNSRNGTSVNGRLLLPDEEYQLEPEDEVDFAQARYIFLP